MITKKDDILSAIKAYMSHYMSLHEYWILGYMRLEIWRKIGLSGD